MTDKINAEDVIIINENEPDSNERLIEAVNKTCPIGQTHVDDENVSNSYWNDINPGKFTGDIADNILNTSHWLHKSTIPYEAFKDIDLGEELMYTRFGRKYFDWKKDEDMSTEEIIRELLFSFTKWTDVMKGRLPVFDYDIADERLTPEDEYKFYTLVFKWLFATITKDSEKYSEIDDDSRISFDPHKVKRVCRALSILFCAYYHHAFDI